MLLIRATLTESMTAIQRTGILSIGDCMNEDVFQFLPQIESPAELRALSETDLSILADEVRAFLLHSVSRTGGHLSSNLGVVELSIALHYVFNTPKDRIIWDVGHQAYVHKILTGRREAMAKIRQAGGISGFPKRSESEYDSFGVGHSSTSISAALGMAIAANYQGLDSEHIAVIGDGAMTAGMAFEALNHAGGGLLDKANLLVILNDNNMSISPNVGALNNYLARILSSHFYASMRNSSQKVLCHIPGAWELASRTESHLKTMLVPGSLFESLGFNYIGPVDGHDLSVLLPTLRNLADLKGPRLLHVVTQKGKGFEPAEQDPCSYHGVGSFNKVTGEMDKKAPAGALTYTQVFSQWLCAMAKADERLMAITPAMREGSGLVEFSEQFPERYMDVGIAEQHAVTLAAGLACEGIKPIVAIYSSFLQRAYDQVIHDVALQNLDVTFAIDRAGLVGPDGDTHAGNYDLSYLRCIPNLTIMVPSDEAECWQMLSCAFHHSGPCAVRYPRGVGTGAPLPAHLESIDLGKAVYERKGKKLALLVFGHLRSIATQVAEVLDATVVNMRFLKPLDTAVLDQIALEYEHVVTIEDNVIAGGGGSAINEYFHQQNQAISLLNLGLPDRLLGHGDSQLLLARCGLDYAGILAAIRAQWQTYAEAR